MPRLRPDAGQAAAEYVALVAVAATVLAGVAVAAPAVGEGVVATIRTGLCIVGGDICRPAGAGVSFSPLGVQAEIDGGLTLGYRSAEGWRFDDAAAAAGFLARAQRDAAAKAARPPSVRWHAVTAGADGMAVAALDGLGGAEIRVGAAGALGVQVEGGRRTLAFELERRDVVQLGDLPGFPGAEGQGARAVEEGTGNKERV